MLVIHILGSFWSLLQVLRQWLHLGVVGDGSVFGGSIHLGDVGDGGMFVVVVYMKFLDASTCWRRPYRCGQSAYTQ